MLAEVGKSRERPVFYAEFGGTLKTLREDRKWTMRQAAELARQKGVPEVTRQILFRLERGQVKNPEPEVLRGLAALYNLEYEALGAKFAALRYGLGQGSFSRKPLSDTEIAGGVTTPVNQIDVKIEQQQPSRKLRSSAPGESHRGTSPSPVQSSSDPPSRSAEPDDEVATNLAELELREQLLDAVDAITRVANALGNRNPLGTTRNSQTERRASSPRIHRKQTRRSGGRS
jgi:transcriptional regulator with XRE-family HTH domain